MRRYGNRRWGRRKYANSDALRHIEEARKFSSEVGGVDNDVKQFFFTLPSHELRALLSEYGRRYGEDKKEYAEQAYPAWKTGRTKMSGMVAQRLFDLLPNRMPLPKKHELVRKLWEHFCPKSHEVFYVGRGADANSLRGQVSMHFGRVVRDYFISEQLADKFVWLSGGDVRVRQELQNYFQRLKTELLAQALEERFKIVNSYVEGCPEGHVVQTLKLGNHVVEIKCTHLAEGLPDKATMNKLLEQKRRSEATSDNIKTAFGYIVAIAVFFLMMKACSK
jgi:hypothetical protein